MTLRLLLFIIGLSFTFSAYAQNVLLFPETMDYTSGDLPPNLCVKHSSELIASINTTDKDAIKELRRVGRRLMRLGYHEYAKDAFEKLLDIQGEMHKKTDPEYIMAYVDLARVYLFLIRYTEMIPIYQEAAELMKKAKGPYSYEYALILSELVEPYFYLKDYQAAELQAQKVLQILEKSAGAYPLQYAITLNNLGIAQLYTTGLETGINTLNKSYKLLQQSQFDPQYRISAAANLAQAYAMAGEKGKAKLLLKEYRPKAEKALQDKVTSYARIWLQFGRAYTTLKDYTAAEQSFAKAYATNSLVYPEVHDIAKQANDLFFKNQFLATCAQAGTTIETILMWKDKFQEEQDLKALEGAYTLVQVIKSYKDELMESFVSEENKLILFRLGAAKVLEAGVELAYELYQRTGEDKYLEEAFELSEYGKSTLLIHALRSKDNKRFGQLPPELLAQETDFQNQKRALEKRLIESNSKAEKQEWTAALNQLNRKILTFKNTLAKKYPQYYQHHYKKESIRLKDLQKALPGKTALIEYMLTEDRSFAFIITKNQIEMVDLRINYKKMNRNADQLRHSLSDYTFLRDQPELARQEYVASSAYFYQAFIAPLVSKVESIQKLIIVPDRELGHLPFEVFIRRIPSPNQSFQEMEYLAKDFAISYSYSATLLIEKKAQDAQQQPESEGVLAFAGYYGDPKQIALADSLNRRANLRSIRSSLQPLAGAEQEVKLMREYLLGEFFDGPLAGEALFKEKAKSYNIIHLAMHGLLNTTDPILSSLAFSEDGNIEEDNFLHAYEISELDLKARLVVLSACETGYGKFRQGEGVMSLAHSFMYAGASSVLVSLWQVNDAATGKIMKYYYMAMSVGFEKDEAIRIAKLQYLREQQGIGAHPAFWGAFILMGDTAPIELYCKAGWTFWQKVAAVSGGFVLILAGLLFWRWRRSREI